METQTLSSTQLLLAAIGLIQALLLFGLAVIWAEIKATRKEGREELREMQAAVGAEILRLRERLHKLEPTNESIERFIAALRGEK
jgi:hypothetical protein